LAVPRVIVTSPKLNIESLSPTSQLGKIDLLYQPILYLRVCSLSRIDRLRHGGEDANGYGISEEQNGSYTLVPEFPMCFRSDRRRDGLGFVPKVDGGYPVEGEDAREVHLFPCPEEHVLVGKNVGAA
jgi:hypothetical protein